MSQPLHRLIITAIILADLVAVGLGFALPSLLRFSTDTLGEAMATASGLAVAGLGAVLWVAILAAREAYAPRVLVSVSSQLARIVSAAVPAWVLTHILAFLLKAQVPFESRLAVGLSLPSIILLLVLVRLGATRPLARRAYRRVATGPVLILGDTERADRLARDIADSDARARAVALRPLSATSSELAAGYVLEYGIGEVVVEPDGRSTEEVFDTAFACLDARAEVRIVSNQFQVLMGRTAIGDVEGIPVMQFRRFDLAGPEVGVKRFVDVVGSAIGLILLSPVLLAIALAIKFSSPGPIFFRQERVGLRGKRFTMFKFRSMGAGNDPKIHQDYLKSFIRDGAPAAVGEDGIKIYKLTHDPRVTRVGAWIRAFSLDELPQLWNVLKGDMSLVGPRPCLPFEWDLYRPWQRRRLDVSPGCTGLWQVTARSHVGFEEMVILDLHYAHHGTVWRDLALIAQTIPAMIRGRGSY